jgi:shikimate kinase
MGSPGPWERIFLIGPRGSGKSTVARVLAELLGWSWLDADAELERRIGRSIRTLFAEEGEEGFRNREADLIRELVLLSRHVIATGGGVILRPASRELLRSAGRVVWLNADAETLWGRMQGDSSTAERRPVLTVGGRAEVEHILELREPLYRACAHQVLWTAGREPLELAREIMLKTMNDE